MPMCYVIHVHYTYSLAENHMQASLGKDESMNIHTNREP